MKFHWYFFEVYIYYIFKKKLFESHSPLEDQRGRSHLTSVSVCVCVPPSHYLSLPWLLFKNGSSLWYRNGVLVLLFAVKGVGIGQEELKKTWKGESTKRCAVISCSCFPWLAFRSSYCFFILYSFGKTLKFKIKIKIPLLLLKNECMYGEGTNKHMHACGCKDHWPGLSYPCFLNQDWNHSWETGRVI